MRSFACIYISLKKKRNNKQTKQNKQTKNKKGKRLEGGDEITKRELRIGVVAVVIVRFSELFFTS